MLIQVKSTGNLGSKGCVPMLRDAIFDMLEIPSPPNCSKWLYLRLLRGPWFFERVDDYSKDRAVLRRQVVDLIDGWRDGVGSGSTLPEMFRLADEELESGDDRGLTLPELLELAGSPG